MPGIISELPTVGGNFCSDESGQLDWLTFPTYKRSSRKPCI
jgi:hypothetical protein